MQWIHPVAESSRRPERHAFRVVRLACTLLLAVASTLASADERVAVPEPPSSAPETVVLLHGLGRSSFSMKQLASSLEDAGYVTVNIDYPSTRLEAEDLGGMLEEQLAACCL
jgi:hypothetical protein